MRWLNYHHFLYFYMVVREGGIQPAAKALKLTHPTISTQIRLLEEQLGEDLFDRTQRKLQLTELGRVAFQYAEDIFQMGQDFLDAVENRPSLRTTRLVVGATAALPKAVVRQLLAPALELDESIQLVCREDEHDRLLAQLAVHELDVVLSDMPLSPAVNIRAFNHELGRCGATFFASKTLKSSLQGSFPNCLDGAPMITPLTQSALGRGLRQWIDERDLRPRIVAEVQDSALVKALGRDGLGVFCLPSIVQNEVVEMYGAKVVGHAPEIQERFYAISPERRLHNPGVLAICNAAREHVFTT